MSKRMLIDGTHAEEIRVVVADDNKIDDFEVETAGKAQLKGNLYVAVVDRVEASLQAAFLRYGGVRNGFLAFSEIHPQWFDLPEEEKNALLQEYQDLADQRRGTNDDNAADEEAGNSATEGHEQELSDAEMDEDARAAAIANSLPVEETATAIPSKAPRRIGTGAKTEEQTEDKPTKEQPDTSIPNTRKPPIHRRYRIEQVLKPGMKVLVQVVKEERGGKGAAMTTYYAMAGRYSVLMPNTPYAGGISRKISDSSERKPLREIYKTLKFPNEYGLIIRTAGVGQEQKSIQKDVDTLTEQWKTLWKSFAKEGEGACVHEDGSLTIRAIRDMFNEDIDEIIVAGRRVYRQTKDYAKALLPDAAKAMKEHRAAAPLFTHYQVEQKLNKLHHTRVVLPSGGYLVINPTEALVSVDVNSGSATQGSNIEETALKTNLEAAEELARQIRLRDLAGLIVVDFIDMDHRRHNGQVERAMRKYARRDRARMQVGDISNFGLMEISRQRLRPSLSESTFVECPHCQGSGLVVAPATAALMILRRLEEPDVAGEADRVIVHTSAEMALYVLNHKRTLIQDLEAKYKYQIQLRADPTVMVPDMRLELVRVKSDGTETSQNIEVELREQPYEPPEVRYSKKKPYDKADRPSKKRDTKPEKSATKPNRKADAQADTRADAQADDRPKRNRKNKEHNESKTEDTATKPADNKAKKSSIKRLTRGGKAIADQQDSQVDVASNESPEPTSTDKPKRTRKAPSRKSNTAKSADTTANPEANADKKPARAARKAPARRTKTATSEENAATVEPAKTEPNTPTEPANKPASPVKRLSRLWGKG